MIASRSYVCPSLKHTGSAIFSIVSGQQKSSGSFIAGATPRASRRSSRSSSALASAMASAAAWSSLKRSRALASCSFFTSTATAFSMAARSASASEPNAARCSRRTATERTRSQRYG